MKLYTYSAARQQLADVLDQASRQGEVQIRRQDGRVYAVTPVAASAQSPFARVTGERTRLVTSTALVRLAREEGQVRGERVLQNAATGKKGRRSDRATTARRTGT